ncbi:PREDICTED: WAT1-related protein At1g68170-like [Tarenaya hassleriana]|uniref:WAT1-related protein At1g68170-like n=1 Tax=Tarenaya hassleriana TaxID=28532 RepID=UPI00053C1C3C|nr:PREDICTED: WAT1-related protein At1g68170-like [Tarenaya hassleriana]
MAATTTTKGQLCNFMHGMKPAMLMVVVQVAFAGVNVLYKLAANDGMSLRVVVAYRFIFSAAFMVPVALIFERGKRPKITWTVLFQAFLCGLFGGSLAQNLYLQGLALTSATFVSALTNLIPAITFILAISFRLERLELGKAAGKAKVLGTLMGIGGAMLLTFYKGFVIDFMKTDIDLLSSSGDRHVSSVRASSGHRVLGASLALGSCFSYAIWLIIQTKMSEKYPCYYSSTALMSIMGLIQAVLFALCVERDWSQWKLGWNIRLWTVAFSGIMGSGLMVTLMSWCVRLRGPLFVSVFNPLLLVLVAIAGALFLDEKLYLGSVLGAILIVCGLYVVLWGKGKEMKQMARLVPSRTLQETMDVVVESPGNIKATEKDKEDHVNK